MDKDILAAKTLLSSTMVPKGSVVTIFAGVKPGVTFVEDSPLKRPVKFKVPRAKGNYVGFFIDDAPDAMYAHPVRYAWIDLDKDTFASVGASFPMTLYSAKKQILSLNYRVRVFEEEGIRFEVAEWD